MTIVFNRTFLATLLAALLGVLLFAAGSVYAEEETTDGSAEPEVGSQPLPPKVRADLLEKREEVRTIRTDKREDVVEKREEVRDTRSDKREDLAENRTNVRASVDERRDALRARGLDNARDRITANAKRFISILEAGAKRMGGIIERIESRMARFQEAGVDTSVAQSHLDSAKESLRAIFIKIDDIKGEVTDTADDATPKDVIEKMKELLRAAHQDLKNAAQSIREAIKALKEAAAATSGDEASTESE